MDAPDLGRTLLDTFARLPDHRSPHGRRHPLPAILALATAAMLDGAEFVRDRPMGSAPTAGSGGRPRVHARRTPAVSTLASGLPRSRAATPSRRPCAAGRSPTWTTRPRSRSTVKAYAASTARTARRPVGGGVQRRGRPGTGANGAGELNTRRRTGGSPTLSRRCVAGPGRHMGDALYCQETVCRSIVAPAAVPCSSSRRISPNLAGRTHPLVEPPAGRAVRHGGRWDKQATGSNAPAWASSGARGLSDWPGHPQVALPNGRPVAARRLARDGSAAVIMSLGPAVPRRRVGAACARALGDRKSAALGARHEHGRRCRRSGDGRGPRGAGGSATRSSPHARRGIGPISLLPLPATMPGGRAARPSPPSRPSP